MSLSPVAITPAPTAVSAVSDDAEFDRSSALAALAPWLLTSEPIAQLDGDLLQAFVRDLAFAAAALIRADRSRAIVPTEPRRAAWELGLERDGDALLVSLFRAGPPPEVGQTAHRIPLDRACSSLLTATESLAERQPGAALHHGLELARAELSQAAREPARRQPTARPKVRIESRGRSPLGIVATVGLRQGTSEAERSAELCRADLHSLLVLGTVDLHQGESTLRLAEVHVFLVAEQLLSLSSAALDAVKAGRTILRQLKAGAVTLGVRGDDGTGMTLLVFDRAGAASQLPAVSAGELARASCRFATDLARAIVAADRAQSSNLRLSALRAAARSLKRRLRPAAARRSVLNPAPESYRAFAESDPPKAPAAEGREVGKLRFTESWRAAVGGIDLRSIMVCGDRLIVGSRIEVACLERSLGLLLWRKPTERAVSIMTPRGLARLTPDGRLDLLDLDDGDLALSLQLEPCVGAATSGAVVNAPALPPLLLVSEGSHHLAAVDLDAGEVRWRRSVPRRGPLRMRRAGKLMVVAAGTTELAALDLLTGEVVWRRCGRLSYFASPAIAADTLVALSCESRASRAKAQIERIDPWSGEELWARPLPRPVRPAGPPHLSGGAAMVITEDDDRLGLLALELDSGALRFDLEGGLVAGDAACMVVDDTVIASGAAGQLVAVDAADGHLRYRHVFASWHGRESLLDRPKSFQPVLRSGALFVPQSEVYVVRPQDGTVLGRVPCDLVPDLLRVDERCGVYVAEASGHLAAYAAQPTLRLVTTVTPG
ncbi:MAG: PQQ-binding-like beta-propeller repeat protein [Deltaproteobacteria bacterium]|jgi:outer membrane protein assembly factor BamB|nr:PQQ-binding-like beta-propeller repeat protein [Deltaproteobacteria bacterium]MBW2532899.1 PQQ-binding-like beta-propeller repeat protein [Deltaproteobacteria bacterium]